MRRSLRQLLLTSTVLAALAAATPAFAQTATAGSDEIVVTGTRIQRPDLTSNSPIATVGAADIAITGTVNIETLLNDLPQTLPGFTQTSNNPGSGTANVDLRGLGPQRTLVLVDGKRFVSSTPPDQASVSGVVDLNTIPTALIDRVDVVTGGASAVYGSDAISGVVNFILKRNFTGAQFDATYGATEKGDAETADYSATFGADLDEGRGNVVVNFGYTDRQPLFRGERGFAAVELDDDGEGGLIQSGSPTVPQGAITDSFADFPEGIIFESNGAPRAFRVPQDYYNFAPTNYIQVPQKRWTATGLARYQLAPNVELYARGSYANNQVPTQVAPTPIADVFEIDLNTNPFVDPATRAIILDPRNDADENGLNDYDDNGNGVVDPGDSDGVVNSTLRLRLPETLPRVANHESNVYQLVLGARGDLPWALSGWTYDVSWQYGRSKTEVAFSGDAQRRRFQQGLTAVAGPNGPVCVDTSGGCVPINPFGLGNFTAEQYDFIQLRGLASSTTQETIATGSISGPLGAVKSPFADDPINVAVGAEYRQEKLRVDPDQNFASGEILGFDPISPVNGQFDVRELFLEVSVPIVQNKPFVRDLTFEGGYRYSDYSTVGGVDTYKAGGQWEPVEGVRLRGLYQRAVRAPNVFELFSPQSETQEGGASDPCSAGNADALAASAELRALCVSTGVPTALVGVLPEFAANQAPITIGGNPNLREESSDTYTIGAVLQPPQVEGLTVTIDYYNIKLDDAVAGFFGSAQAVLDACYAPGASSELACAAIRRRPNGQVDLNGGVDQRNANIASIETSGVDFGVAYRLDPARIGLSGLGSSPLRLSTNITWLDTYDVTPNPAAAPVNCVKTFGNATCNTIPQPEWRWNAGVAYDWNDWTFDARWSHIGESTDYRIATNGDDPATIATDTIEGRDYFDIGAAWSPVEWATLRLGVQNITDEDYPIVGDVDEQSNGYPTVYTPFGRQWFVAVQLRR